MYMEPIWEKKYLFWKYCRLVGRIFLEEVEVDLSKELLWVSLDQRATKLTHETGRIFEIGILSQSDLI